MTFSGLIAPLRRPPAAAGVLFAALSAGIMANALLLQPRQHPSPLVATRGELAAEAHGAGDSSPTADLVSAVQAELSALGYYAGPLDGIAGNGTMAAISVFQSAAGIERPVIVTYELLSDLRAEGRRQRAAAERAAPVLAAEQAEPQPAAAEPATTGTTGPDDRVALVQTALARAAYGPLTADGVFGPETREAIRRFQDDHGLTPTGMISDALIVELRATGALDAE